MPSLCGKVLDQQIRRTVSFQKNFISLRVRCLDGSEEGAVGCDFLRKEKNATRNKHLRAACVGMDKSSAVLMRRSKSTVIGCLWRDFMPMMQLSPFLVRAKKPFCKWRRRTELM